MRSLCCMHLFQDIPGGILMNGEGHNFELDVIFVVEVVALVLAVSGTTA